jgi:Xaa-Pro aminopeptidase
MNERIKKVYEYLDHENIDCLLLDSPFDILYLLHINESFNYIELNTVLLITKEKNVMISTPLTLPLLKEYLSQEIETIECSTTSFVKNRYRFVEEIKAFIDSQKIKKIGLTSVQYLDISKNCVRVDNPVPYIAAVKSDEEIGLIKKSSQILMNVFENIKDHISKGCGEIELRNSVDVELHKEGIERRAFPTKVAFGKKTSQLFPVSTMDTLGEDDMVLIDIGSVYKGYIAEMARTIFFGELTAKQREIYDIVFTGYQKMKDFLKPGIVASAVDEIVRGHFRDLGHDQFFFTPLGESTGMVKGGITLAPNNKEVIKPGMVFVVEPGLYLPDWGGIKIKETILVTEDGIEELTGGPEPIE